MLPYAALIVVALVGTGCATIITGRTQTVPVVTDPPGATATFQPTGQTITTPGTVDLPRKHTYLVQIDRDGFRSKATILNREASPWLAGNVVLGGVIGLVGDLLLGGGYWLRPSSIDVQLEPTDAPAAAPQGAKQADN